MPVHAVTGLSANTHLVASGSAIVGCGLLLKSEPPSAMPHSLSPAARSASIPAAVANIKG